MNKKISRYFGLLLALVMTLSLSMPATTVAALTGQTVKNADRYEENDTLATAAQFKDVIFGDPAYPIQPSGSKQSITPATYICIDNVTIDNDLNTGSTNTSPVDEDYYLLNAAESGFNFELNLKMPNDSDLDFEVLDSKGTLIQSGAKTGNGVSEKISFKNAASQFIIHVKAHTPSGYTCKGSYSVTIENLGKNPVANDKYEPNDSAAAKIEGDLLSSTTKGSINRPGDYDLFYFTVSKPIDLKIDLQTPKDTPAYAKLHISLYDSKGVVMDAKQQAGDSYCDAVLNPSFVASGYEDVKGLLPGKYTVQICADKMENYAYYSDYTLLITARNSIGCSQDFSLKEAFTAAEGITAKGEKDVYTVRLPKNNETRKLPGGENKLNGFSSATEKMVILVDARSSNTSNIIDDISVEVVKSCDNKQYAKAYGSGGYLICTCDIDVGPPVYINVYSKGNKTSFAPYFIQVYFPRDRYDNGSEGPSTAYSSFDKSRAYNWFDSIVPLDLNNNILDGYEKIAAADFTYKVGEINARLKNYNNTDQDCYHFKVYNKSRAYSQKLKSCSLTDNYWVELNYDSPEQTGVNYGLKVEILETRSSGSSLTTGPTISTTATTLCNQNSLIPFTLTHHCGSDYVTSNFDVYVYVYDKNKSKADNTKLPQNYTLRLMHGTMPADEFESNDSISTAYTVNPFAFETRAYDTLALKSNPAAQHDELDDQPGSTGGTDSRQPPLPKTGTSVTAATTLYTRASIIHGIGYGGPDYFKFSAPSSETYKLPGDTRALGEYNPVKIGAGSYRSYEIDVTLTPYLLSSIENMGLNSVMSKNIDLTSGDEDFDKLDLTIYMGNEDGTLRALKVKPQAPGSDNREKSYHLLFSDHALASDNPADQTGYMGDVLPTNKTYYVLVSSTCTTLSQNESGYLLAIKSPLVDMDNDSMYDARRNIDQYGLESNDYTVQSVLQYPEDTDWYQIHTPWGTKMSGFDESAERMKLEVIGDLQAYVQNNASPLEQTAAWLLNLLFDTEFSATPQVNRPHGFDTASEQYFKDQQMNIVSGQSYLQWVPVKVKLQFDTGSKGFANTKLEWIGENNTVLKTAYVNSSGYAEISDRVDPYYARWLEGTGSKNISAKAYYIKITPPSGPPTGKPLKYTLQYYTTNDIYDIKNDYYIKSSAGNEVYDETDPNRDKSAPLYISFGAYGGYKWINGTNGIKLEVEAQSSLLSAVESAWEGCVDIADGIYGWFSGEEYGGYTADFQGVADKTFKVPIPLLDTTVEGCLAGTEAAGIYVDNNNNLLSKPNTEDLYSVNISSGGRYRFELQQPKDCTYDVQVVYYSLTPVNGSNWVPITGVTKKNITETKGNQKVTRLIASFDINSPVTYYARIYSPQGRYTHERYILSFSREKGSELIVNGGFEDNYCTCIDPPWYGNPGSSTCEMGLGYAYGDSKNNARIYTSSTEWSEIYQRVNVEQNKKYTLRAEVQFSSTSVMSKTSMGIRDSSSKKIQEIPASAQVFPFSSGYTELSVTFDSGSNTTVIPYIGFTGTGSGEWIRIDNVTLTEAK